jgi:hypothetical protein
MIAAPRGLAGLHPAYFALVMATGIVSIAAELREMRWLALGLLALNVLFYAVLWSATVLRVIRHRDRLLADVLDHNRSVGFFTIVAGTNVLGSQFVVVYDLRAVAVVLWVSGAILWAFVTYTVLTVLTVKREKPPLAEGINGGWLLAVVAAQSVAVLAALLAGRSPRAGHVAGRRDALYLDHIPHLLPLHVFRVEPGRSHAAVLDQHGGCGDFDAGRCAPGPERRSFGAAGRPAAVRQGSHAPVLGDGDVVDSNAGHSGDLAARVLPLSDLV